MRGPFFGVYDHVARFVFRLKHEFCFKGGALERARGVPKWDYPSPTWRLSLSDQAVVLMMLPSALLELDVLEVEPPAIAEISLLMNDEMID